MTLPHKIAALEGVDTLDDVARRTGAVNTVIVKEDGISMVSTRTFSGLWPISLMCIQIGW